MPMLSAAAPSRATLVLEAIRCGIPTGELRPGRLLVETEPAAQTLGVSETPVREALKTLVGSGLPDDLRDQAAPVSVAAWRTAPTWEREAEEHRTILTAAEAGHGDRAAEPLRTRISGFVSRTFPEGT